MAVDANFRLKLKNRKLEDISLAPGWGYYVEEKEYHAYLKEHVSENEVRSTRIRRNFKDSPAEQINYCQSHLHAIDHGNKHLSNYSASGVGASKCARHTFVRPNGVGDLQRGEK